MRAPIHRFLLLWCFAPLLLPAQGVNFFSTDPARFLQEFSGVLIQSRSEAARQASDAFSAVWAAAPPDLQAQVITQVNLMVSKRLKPGTDMALYAQCFALLQSGSAAVKVPMDDFLEVSMQCITDLEPQRASKYFRSLAEYLPAGYPVRRTRFSWQATQQAPRLMFVTLSDASGSYAAPVVRFSGTDLRYVSPADSTIIRGAAGDLNLLSLNFTGSGGRVTWEKLKLDPQDVYCDFGAYKLNLNYGFVEVDTVLLHYNSLLKTPVKGRFEDANIGFRNINTANYPYFKSHEGGVVIENFIPNVRYEGGFSMMGTRLIGSAYDVWVDMPEPAAPADPDGWYAGYSASDYKADESRSDGWDESGWATASSEAATFSESDTDLESAEEVPAWPAVGSLTGDESDLYAGKQLEHVPAKLEILRKGQAAMRLRGESFVLDQTKLVGKLVEAALYTSGGDSLYHPSMDVLYTVKDSTVTLKKPKKSALRSIPFISSYHEYFLYFESINWDLRNDKIDFTAFIDRENKVSAIESFDYFTKARFDQFKGVLPFNPIGVIYRYHVEHPEEPIFPEKILADPAYRMMDQLTAFERSLPMLEGSGFITYNSRSREIKPLPKLMNWAMAARQKKDFDAIQIISKVDTGSHAVLNMETMDIEMRGVRFFTLSDSVYVRVVPANARVTVQENRNLNFGGVMAAGKLNFYASPERPSFTFDYESYSIRCDSIDSIRFELVRNPPEGYVPTPLERALSQTVFEGVTGVIHIDNPYNKSGEKRKQYRQYPVFDSWSNSYLYWDDPAIEGGVYDKKQMYYAVDPFVLDSLEDFNGTSLLFDGEFYSSEIFPAFRQQLQVMEDFTLGFRKQAPPEGYPIYNNNGRFFSDIILDNNGLRGDGTVEYLGTIARSDSFVFHFDSVMANVNYFNLKRGYRGGVYFPQVDANSAVYKWYTKRNALAVSSTYEALSVFDGQGKFTGTLSITEKGMVGDGEIALGQVRVRGDSIIFNEMDFVAPGSDFIIADPADSSDVHFIARNVDIKYDVWRHTSAFESRQPEARLAEFPGHQFATSLQKGAFARATNDLKLQGASAYARDNYFVSTDPAKDSLQFTGKDAYYGIDNREILVNGVPFLYVADAIVTPPDQKVVIQPDGMLRPIENAVVEADRDSKLHKIYDAVVRVESRKQYQGSGKYNYIEVNGKGQYIEFDNIRVEDGTTVASGIIRESDAFYLTERIFFRGNAELDASRKFLSFEGEVKIESENPVFKGAWFNFEKTIVDPDSVFIPIADDLTNEANENLTVGLNYVPENRTFYSNFLQAKEDDDDLEVLSASGGLTFDRRRKEFRIGSREKLKNQVFKGATVSFNDAANTITSQGYLNFPYHFREKTLTMKMAGAWKEDLRKKEVSTDLVMAADLSVIPIEAFQKLADNLVYLTASNKNIDFNQRSFLESISELLDEGQKTERETGKFIANVQNAMVYTDIKLAEQLPYSLLLSGVNFHYDRTFKALYSDSEVGLIGIAGKPVNKIIGAKIVYQFGNIDAEGNQEEDKLTIYLEVDEFNWVYFQFEKGTIRTLSSYYDEYNNILQAAIDKGKAGEGYRFEMATEDERIRFQQDFVKKYIK
ncbi:MAG: hypothetical protein NW241_20585 [Bacteroidia bacterium]|nr:hypothetical protein [Bacteroidia bacterium]